MTYIEFFDESALENISTCLTNKPDRVIYIGNDLTLMNKHIDNYKKVLSARNFDIEFISKTVPRSKLESAINALSDIVEQYDDCVFDITGGDEMYTLALGIVYANHPNRGIQIHKMNLKNNSVYDCDRDGKTVFKETPALSVEENVFFGEVGDSDSVSDIAVVAVYAVERVFKIFDNDYVVVACIPFSNNFVSLETEQFTFEVRNKLRIYDVSDFDFHLICSAERNLAEVGVGKRFNYSYSKFVCCISVMNVNSICSGLGVVEFRSVNLNDSFIYTVLKLISENICI